LIDFVVVAEDSLSLSQWYTKSGVRDGVLEGYMMIL